MADEKQLIDIEALSHYHAKAKNYNDSTYVAKEQGKGLSQENFTTVEKNQLAALVAGGIPEGGGTIVVEDEIIILPVETFDAENMTGTISEESFEILNNYTGDKPMYLQVPPLGLVPYLAGRVFVSNFGSVYYRIEIDDERVGKTEVERIPILNKTGKIPSYLFDLPSYVDDVIEGYYREFDGLFYNDSDFTDSIPRDKGKIYVDLNTSNTYRAGDTMFVQLNPKEYTVATNADIDALFN